MIKWTWKDIACASVGLSIVVGAHVWLFAGLHSGEKSWRQDRGADVSRPACEYYPGMVSGFACRYYGKELIPPETWAKLPEELKDPARH